MVQPFELNVSVREALARVIQNQLDKNGVISAIKEEPTVILGILQK